MNTDTEYLVIGAGPAGLQLGYYLERNGRDYLILERADKPGAFFQRYPRHRKLISINKVHTGKRGDVQFRYDWNSLLSDNDALRFTRYTPRYFPAADDLLRYLEDFARTFELKIRYNTPVSRISRQGDVFVATTEDGRTFTARYLVVASGFTRSYVPDFPGAELCETYASHDIDPETYAGKRVLVVGKGNSAFETADHLTETAALIHVVSPHSVVMAWQTHYVGHLRAVNNNFLDTYQLKSQNAVIDASIMRVEPQGDGFAVHMAYSHANGQTTVRQYDHVILCTGFRFDASIFDETCSPEVVYDGKFPAQTSEWESVNVPGLYFAGTLMHACDYRKTMSGFIHGFRHNISTMSRLFEQKHHGRPWPAVRLPAEVEPVLDKIIDRLDNSAGLFLQPGFLQDLIVISESAGTADYYEELVHNYIHESAFGQNDHYYTISLEYGHFTSDPFNIERDPDPMKGNEAAYLHPVIRRYNCGLVVSEHHIQDDLENEWGHEDYVAPARAYLAHELAQPVMLDHVEMLVQDADAYRDLS